MSGIRLFFRALLLGTAFAAALFIYPALHECGHLFAAWVTETEIAGWSLWTHPAVSLRLSGSVAAVQFIAVSGGWFPLGLLLMPDAGSLCLYGVKSATALLSFFSGAESLIKGLLYVRFAAPDSCDAVWLLKMFPSDSATVFLSLAVQMAAAAGYLYATRPLARVIRCFSDAGHQEKRRGKPVVRRQIFLYILLLLLTEFCVNAIINYHNRLIV